MKKLSLVSIFIFALIVSGIASAQTNTQQCQYLGVSNQTIREGLQSFPDCAQAIITDALRAGQFDASGYWGNIFIYVNTGGEVFYVNERNRWIRWGTIDLSQAQAPVPTQVAVPTQAPTPIPAAPTSDQSTVKLTMDQVFALAKLDINDFWQSVFDQANTRYFEPDIQLINRGNVRTRCGVIGDSTGPAYCSGDNTIYLPIRFMDDQFRRIGDFATVIIIAHEWGHAIESHLNLLGSQANRTNELLADCLAGGYTNYLIHDSKNAIIEDGDVQEAATALFEAGDNLPWFDSRTHGSGKERIASLQLGMDQGWEACFQQN